MTYNEVRHLADSFGLIFLGITFLVMVGWTFRKGAGREHRRAKLMIFDEEDRKDG